MILSRKKSLRGEIIIPGDKSISHRGIMLGALSTGNTILTNFLQGADCLSTIKCFQMLGIEIKNTQDTIVIKGKGLHGLKESSTILDAGNSGTTTRLLSGILAGQNFTTTITGDESIQKRPMKRIMDPLAQMGASIKSLNGNGCAPLEIIGGKLKSIHYQSPIASAQVKSAVLLAGLYAEGKTSVTEPSVSRNHTELMLRMFGGEITTTGCTATVTPEPSLVGQKLQVPGDISSAAFFIAAALITPDSEVLIKDVGINPTRDGILQVCKAMNASISYENVRDNGGEPVADLVVKTSQLTATTVEGDLIPTLIDEIPAIAILACFAEGTTIIKDAAELKVKESNRIDLVVDNLKKMGADIEATEDGMIIRGGNPLHGASIHTKYDHRIAMAFAIAGINAEGETQIQNSECVDVSYPTFFEDLNLLVKK